MEEEDDDLYGTTDTTMHNPGSANQADTQMKTGAGEDEEVVEVEEEEEDEVRYATFPCTFQIINRQRNRTNTT